MAYRKFDAQYKLWRKLVLRRFENKCNRCGSKRKLQAHHIKSWREHPELRFDVSNGECICRKCHELIHPFMKKYRRKRRKVKKVEIEVKKEVKKMTEQEFLNHEFERK